MVPSRRQFIQRCATVLGGAATFQAADRSRLAATSDEALVNWAGNYRYSTDRLHRVTIVAAGAGVRQAAGSAEGARHAPLLQRDRRQHLSSPLAQGDGSSRRAGLRGANGDGRGGHELRPVVPVPPRARVCAAQPRLPAAHLRRGRLRHGDAWLGRHERQPGDGRLGPGDSSPPTATCSPSRARRTASTFLGARRQSRRARRGHQGDAGHSAYVRDAAGRLSETCRWRSSRTTSRHRRRPATASACSPTGRRERINEVWVKRRVDKGVRR